MTHYTKARGIADSATPWAVLRWPDDLGNAVLIRYCVTQNEADWLTTMLNGGELTEQEAIDFVFGRVVDKWRHERRRG